MHLSSMETFSRFRADIQADDLDSVITAPREGLEESRLKTRFQYFLLEIYNEARGRYESYLRESEKKDQQKKESDRNFVSPRLVEQPVADLLSMHNSSAGSEADASWFYIELSEDEDLGELAKGNTQENMRYKFDQIVAQVFLEFVHAHLRKFGSTDTSKTSFLDGELPQKHDSYLGME